MISDSFLESDEEENEEDTKDKRGQPLAKLCILKNEHVPVAGKWLTCCYYICIFMYDLHEQALFMYFL